MRDILYIIFNLLFYSYSSGQTYRQPDTFRNSCGNFYNDSLRRIQAIDTIYNLTGIKITEHPLTYAQRLQNENLFRVDSSFNKIENTLKLCYYDKLNKLFKQEFIDIAKDGKTSFVVIFDSNGNEIFRETIDCNSFNLRFRYYYDKENRMIIECVYSSSAGLERTDIYRNDNKTSIMTNCHCDF